MLVVERPQPVPVLPGQATLENGETPTDVAQKRPSSLVGPFDEVLSDSFQELARK